MRDHKGVENPQKNKQNLKKETMGQVWKVKALKDWNAIVKGMEVEIVKKGTSAQPIQSEIQKAFSDKYNIKAPGGVYGNKSAFSISKM